MRNAVQDYVTIGEGNLISLKHYILKYRINVVSVKILSKETYRANKKSMDTVYIENSARSYTRSAQIASPVEVCKLI